MGRCQIVRARGLGILAGLVALVALAAESPASDAGPPLFIGSLKVVGEPRLGKPIDLEFSVEATDYCKETWDLVITYRIEGKAVYEGADSVRVSLGVGDSYAMKVAVLLPPRDTSYVGLKALRPGNWFGIASAGLWFVTTDDTVEVWPDGLRPSGPPRKPKPAWARDTTKYEAILHLRPDEYQYLVEEGDSLLVSRMSPTAEPSYYKVTVSKEELRNARLHGWQGWFVEDSLRTLIDSLLPAEHRLEPPHHLIDSTGRLKITRH